VLLFWAFMALFLLYTGTSYSIYWICGISVLMTIGATAALYSALGRVSTYALGVLTGRDLSPDDGEHHHGHHGHAHYHGHGHHGHHHHHHGNGHGNGPAPRSPSAVRPPPGGPSGAPSGTATTAPSTAPSAMPSSVNLAASAISLGASGASSGSSLPSSGSSSRSSSPSRRRGSGAGPPAPAAGGRPVAEALSGGGGGRPAAVAPDSVLDMRALSAALPAAPAPAAAAAAADGEEKLPLGDPGDAAVHAHLHDSRLRRLFPFGRPGLLLWVFQARARSPLLRAPPGRSLDLSPYPCSLPNLPADTHTS